MDRIDEGSINVNMEKLNILDEKTGVYNTDFFYLRLNEEMKRTTRYDLYFSFMLIELNNKRKIFEELSEDSIAVILDEMGYTVKDEIRGDIDLAGYIEEGLFAVILPETDIHGATILAERIREQLDKGLKRLGQTEEYENLWEDVCVNIAIIEVPEDAKTARIVLTKAKRALVKGKMGQSGSIGLAKPVEKYTAKKKSLIREEVSSGETEEKNFTSLLPFIKIISQPEMKETEKPDEIDVKILKELERKDLLDRIICDGGVYKRELINTFNAVKLLNQKKIIFIEDINLRTAIPCVTPHGDPDIRDKILEENIYCAGTVIYSYRELKEFNSFSRLTSCNTDGALSFSDMKILQLLDLLRGGDAIKGKWIVDPNSPFDTLYMMVRRRFLFKIDMEPGIYYKDLRHDPIRESLYHIYPFCRITPFEALRLLKKNVPLEIMTDGGVTHIINNISEMELFYQMEKE